MKQKDLKKLIAPLASIIALVGTSFGLSFEEATLLEELLGGLLTGILGIIAVFGVWTNNDKK